MDEHHPPSSSSSARDERRLGNLDPTSIAPRPAEYGTLTQRACAREPTLTYQIAPVWHFGKPGRKVTPHRIHTFRGPKNRGDHLMETTRMMAVPIMF
jgi:hypothetical protein